ncbi:MAG: hypothetical protein E7678_03660, partial [Ruminococcaceae bacterium]|nr:hypothetical protein [Oscillospiraceae bacterium]
MKNKILKSFCSLIITTLVLVITIVAFSFTVSASEGYNGTPTMPKQINNENYTQFGLSSNSYDGYYAITTAEELIAWFDYLRNNNGNASAILLADITVNTENMIEMGDKVLSGELEAPTAYTCSAIPALRGVFDGRGHTISGLYMTPTSNGYGGLFYTLYGKIQNLTLANSYISGGNAYTGGICADTWLCNGIFNCKLDSTVKVIGASTVGGIIGYADRINI